ncbi:MAG TPA: biotin--[acetyl-CoA-carboxylase] ligase [Armatimonadetes bacterium]|jgi:BirA family biotin operon repressor/biotin-[acetyl-CoA-carboxylase] ligase|nr:biotin--[acetyl-CoA-carboxylase] ligase [Armatimonadota bacterium]
MGFDVEAATPKTGRGRAPWSVRHVAVTGSTNDDLIAAALGGAAEGAVLVADHQTHGRGRADRRWINRRGRDLLFSLLLRPRIPAAHYGLLSPAAGVAVARALTELTGACFGLKWPNDVLAPAADSSPLGGKVAGILVEANTEARYAVIGIGINLLGEPPDLGGARAVASVEHAGGIALSREGVAAAVLAELDALYGHLCDCGPGPIIDAIEPLDVLRGRHVRIATPAGQVEGTAAGVDEVGRLLIHTPTGTIVADSGEAHLLQ